MSNNIFFTQENLVFSLPLIFVCVVYAYIKFVPLLIGIPLVFVLILFYQFYSKLRECRVGKSLNEDEKIVKELTAEEDKKKARMLGKQARSNRKANEKLRQRLKEEKKAEAMNVAKKKKDDPDDDYDESTLLTFAGSR